MPPKTKFTPGVGLLPIDAHLVPVHVGERVAFKEEHDDHGGKYGLIETLGIDEKAGGVKLDVLVYSPADGVTPDDSTRVRVGLEEIQ
jgi:hypothetical protein